MTRGIKLRWMWTTWRATGLANVLAAPFFYSITKGSKSMRAVAMTWRAMLILACPFLEDRRRGTDSGIVMEQEARWWGPVRYTTACLLLVYPYHTDSSIVMEQEARWWGPIQYH
jgi:hypothetical protein